MTSQTRYRVEISPIELSILGFKAMEQVKKKGGPLIGTFRDHLDAYAKKVITRDAPVESSTQLRFDYSLKLRVPEESLHIFTSIN